MGGLSIAYGRQTEGTIACNNSGDTVFNRRCGIPIPAKLGVEVGMDIHETRRHDLPGGVYLFPAPGLDRAHRGNAVAVEQDLYYEGSVMYNLFAINKDIYTSTSGGARDGVADEAKKARGQRQRQAFSRLRRPSRRR